jgi:hypothetical protein
MTFSEFSAGSFKRAAARVKYVVAPKLPAPVRPTPAGRPPPLVARAAPGLRKATMFFNDYPRFYETSNTASSAGRLNLRFEAMFAENRDILDGARVLDIASHDGRWSLAALACGAQSVVGVEARPNLVANAEASLAHYGYGPDRARFVTGDVHDVLNDQKFEVDVVLCLGFLYHTLRYNELLSGIRKSGAHHVLIDTQAQQMMNPKPAMGLLTENVAAQRNAARDRYAHGNTVLSGRPNLEAIRIMMDAYGYQVEPLLSDWGAVLRDNPDVEGCGDYARQQRITIRCVDRRAAAST